MVKAAKKTRSAAGRPPKGDQTMVQLSQRWPRAMIEEVDLIVEKERFGQSDRASVLRELVAIGLKHRRQH